LIPIVVGSRKICLAACNNALDFVYFLFQILSFKFGTLEKKNFKSRKILLGAKLSVASYFVCFLLVVYERLLGFTLKTKIYWRHVNQQLTLQYFLNSACIKWDPLGRNSFLSLVSTKVFWEFWSKKTFSSLIRFIQI
jgi:hypothetical protein